MGMMGVFLPVSLRPPVNTPECMSGGSMGVSLYSTRRVTGTGGQGAVHVFYSSAMSVATGCLHRADVLLWRGPRGICAGKALMFIRVHSGPTALHAVLVSQFRQIAGPVYSDATAEPKLVEAACVLKAVSYQQDGHAFTVLCPSVL